MSGENILIAEFSKNARETLRIELTEFNGYDLLAMRVWTLDKDGDWVPTRRGLTVRREMIRPIIGALQKAAHEAGQKWAH